jgi:hypothetical protein
VGNRTKRTKRREPKDTKGTGGEGEAKEEKVTHVLSYVEGGRSAEAIVLFLDQLEEQEQERITD